MKISEKKRDKLQSGVKEIRVYPKKQGDRELWMNYL
jgi:hypothetical protein